MARRVPCFSISGRRLGGGLFFLLPVLLCLTGLPVLAQLADAADSLQGEFEDWAKPIAIAGLILGVGLTWFGNDESISKRIGTGVIIISLLIGAADFVDLLS